ncbi:aminopeptidase N [Corynebacterium sp. 320]|uniref:aminopeptidase N n=1 Tax=Corynebacterium TaxID=1716 RepID=UPI00125CB186|nr:MULTISPECIES: aminopeptidase N [Corynebacterium]KAB1501456.1 aminopeptidase N [Corynebacterium sp. 320]KAB1551753.1 aminopeptidase N [Corynebacterium sp. 319]KAB3525814.1 aminopeptidase N [Corynebacterium sp. 250]KAB3538748.1 aminopeptidase N [Corynebacterium sp. 366]QNP92700.1 aminopeptidase N [Corynebacterium zhongnanshanii]
MTSTNLTRTEAASRAQLISNVHYAITLDLTHGATLDTTTFPSTTEITFTSGAGDTFVDLRAAQVHSVELDGTDITSTAVPMRDGRYDEEQGLQIAGLTDGDHTLRIHADAVYSSTGEGLHRFQDPADAQVYMYTQFETADAKRVFACFDQPDIKATYSMEVYTPPAWTLVTNNKITTSHVDEDSHIHRAEVDYPLSTYLIAFCVGPWFSVTDSWTGTIREYPETAGATGVQTSGELTVPLGLYCRQSLAPYLDADELFTITKQGFDWYAEHFGVAYPFYKYDQVFCPEYNMGAMENAGCVTIRDEYIFRSAASHYQYERRADTILHELAHMWFGDLVTMKWWDDLWLNESFATWSAAMSQAEATKFTTAWVTFANKEKAWAYGQDQLSSTHPVFSDATDIVTVDANFDGITYAKGASVLKQLAAYVGLEEFLAGIRSHFVNHAWSNATFDDLLSALEKASGRDLSDWAQQWLKTTGINTLAADVDVADGRYSRFAITQSGAEPGAGETRTHRVGVGIFALKDADTDARTDAGSEAGSASVVKIRDVELDITGSRTDVDELVGTEAGDMILVNDRDLTYAFIALDEQSLAFAIDNIDRVEDPMARSLLWSATWQMTRNAQMRARDFVELVARGAAAETEMAVLEQILAQARSALSHYTDPAWAPTGWSRAREAFWEGAQRTTGTAQLAFIRAYAGCVLDDEAITRLQGILEGTVAIEGLDVDQDLRWQFIIALSGAGVGVESIIDAELTQDTSSTGAMLALQARSAAPGAKEEVWQEITTNGPSMSNLALRHRIAGFTHVGHQELLEPYGPLFATTVVDLWNRLSPEMALRTVEGIYPSWDHSEHTDAAIASLIESAEPGAGWRRPLMEGRDRVARARAAIQADGAQ